MAYNSKERRLQYLQNKNKDKLQGNNTTVGKTAFDYLFPQIGNQTGTIVPEQEANPENNQSGSSIGNHTGGNIGDFISPGANIIQPPGVPNTGYVESNEVKAAKAALEAQQKPGQYQSAWQNSIDETLDKILNREEFSYDLNGDALYQQYKDQYVNQGRQAMMDAIGRASALTGGYGNSWAQSAGQQTFQGYLQGLNDRIPELYQLAMDRYNMTGDQLREQLGLLMNREESEYGRYRDAVNDYLTERGYLTDRYDTERNYDYNKYADDRDFNYQTERDKVADEQWQAEFDEAKKQFLAANPEAAYYYYGNGTGAGMNGIIPGVSTGDPFLDYLFGIQSGSSGEFNGIQLYPTGGSSSGKRKSKGSSSGSSKTDSDVVDEIIRGEWGNGEARKEALREAGYSDEEIKALQAEVNKRFDGGSPYGDDDTGDNKEKADAYVNDDIQDYDALYKDYLAAEKSGSSDDEIRKDIQEQYKNGKISYSTYINLLNNLKLRQDDGIKTSR